MMSKAHLGYSRHVFVHPTWLPCEVPTRDSHAITYQ